MEATTRTKTAELMREIEDEIGGGQTPESVLEELATVPSWHEVKDHNDVSEYKVEQWRAKLSERSPLITDQQWQEQQREINQQIHDLQHGLKSFDPGARRDLLLQWLPRAKEFQAQVRSKTQAILAELGPHWHRGILGLADGLRVQLSRDYIERMRPLECAIHSGTEEVGPLVPEEFARRRAAVLAARAAVSSLSDPRLGTRVNLAAKEIRASLDRQHEELEAGLKSGTWTELERLARAPEGQAAAVTAEPAAKQEAPPAPRRRAAAAAK